MSESQNEREREVAELEAALRMPLPDAARRQIELTLENLRGEGANLAVANTIARDLNQGAVNLSDDARIDGVAVGVNLGRIIYGRDPQEDERRRLVWYLDALANQLYRLPLRGLEERLAQGDGVALPRVYVTLASESFVEVARGQTRELWRYFQDGKLDQPLTSEYDPDYALPDQAIVRVESLNLPRRDERILPLALSRSKLATESVQQRQHLVLLGDPGGGKSTFLRHLAWALAMRGLDQHDEATTLIGWSDDRQLLPILLPLRSLAGRLARDGANATTLYAALRDELLSCNLTQVDDLLRESLHRGAALLLLDGLDEVLPEAADGVANRLTTLQVIRSFAQLHPQARIVMTCRVRAFAEDLRSLLGWAVETLAPFTLGQVRHFVPAWYAELVAKNQMTGEQAGQLEHALIATIVGSPKLRAMAGTPLLLTMMALVLYNKGELPRDRPQLYERILELLLGQWDKVRDGQSLAEAIGLPDWGSERIRPLLDRLSYDAHAGAVSEDGRGRLTRGDVRDALIAFFEAARLPDPWGVARRCLDYFEQRSGLLVPDESASYVFAHLTLQEHCAGRHIALGSDDPVALVMRHRADDRWREPIFLGAGLLRPAELNALLSDLIGREEDEQLKPIDRWYRDLILAAEIGADRDWDYLRTRPMVKVDRIQGDLRRGLVELLRDRNQPLPVAERVRAGFLLGDLGDPRFPVALDDWRRELDRRDEQFGAPQGYWCCIRPGAYRIGGWEEREPAADITLPAFWIARLPITVAQFAPFVELGYRPDAQCWWTPNGWRWKGERTEPWLWDDPSYSGANQPVTGVTWYEAAAFCAWLADQLADRLREGYVVRLPTEAEWEATAAYDAAMHRCSYPWGEEESTSERAIYDASQLNAPAPVGCCPAGVAACGALDLAGNVWEWATTAYKGYPKQSDEEVKDFTGRGVDVPLRGGAYYSEGTSVRCGARIRYPPVIVDTGGGGFRVVLAPRSH